MMLPLLLSAIFVIGGQSNAEGLLALSGGGAVPETVEVDTPDARGFVGYAVSGTPIGYWGDPVNNAPLLRLLTQYCAPSTVFVWFQGEADTRDQGDADNYRRRLSTLMFDIITPACPAMRSVIVQIRSLHPIQEQVRTVQASLGYPVIDSNQFDLAPDLVHLSTDGLRGLSAALKASFP